MDNTCESCRNGVFDDEYDEYACTLMLDEDEFFSSRETITALFGNRTDSLVPCMPESRQSGFMDA